MKNYIIYITDENANYQLDIVMVTGSREDAFKETLENWKKWEKLKYNPTVELWQWNCNESSELIFKN